MQTHELKTESLKNGFGFDLIILLILEEIVVLKVIECYLLVYGVDPCQILYKSMGRKCRAFT